MPTAYTDGVASGEITSFKEYGMLCARAFGACVTMRDEPLSSDIPEFKPNRYNASKIKELEEEISELLSMTEEEKKVAFESHKSELIKMFEEKIAEKLEMEQRYKKMLSKAEKFVPPSPDHVEYKKFIINQLKDSIGWDCDTSFYCNEIKNLNSLSAQEWFDEELKDKKESLNFHQQEMQEEYSRVESRNNWVSKLKEALDEV